MRLWDVFEGKGSVETFQHVHDVLTVVYRPDGKQLACSTLDGQINFWDPLDGSLMYTIEGRRDIAGGRLMTDRRSAANSTSGKYFTTLCYSADGSYILAGGNSKFICMYDIAEQVCPLLLLPCFNSAAVAFLFLTFHSMLLFSHAVFFLSFQIKR